jgi:excisionase family DNA binding protein
MVMNQMPVLDEAAEDFRQTKAAAVDRLLTLKEAAEILGVKPFRAAELVRLGILPAVRLGRQVRISSRRLSGFIQEGGKAL